MARISCRVTNSVGQIKKQNPDRWVFSIIENSKIGNTWISKFKNQKSEMDGRFSNFKNQKWKIQDFKVQKSKIEIGGNIFKFQKLKKWKFSKIKHSKMGRLVFNNSKIQYLKNSIIESFKNSIIQKWNIFKNSKIQKFRLAY